MAAFRATSMEWNSRPRLAVGAGGRVARKDRNTGRQDLLFCFQYDPSTARYSATILGIMRLMAVGTGRRPAADDLIFRRRYKRAAQANLSHQGAD